MFHKAKVQNKKVQELQRLTHIAELIHISLTARDNMPQCGFDDIESADISFLKTVLAEPLPTIHT